MISWATLRASIESERATRTKDWTNALVRQVMRAARLGVCARTEQYRVRQRGRVIELSERGGATIQTVKKTVPAIALDVPTLVEAKLAFSVELSKDLRYVTQYTASVQGDDKQSGQRWYARVDLDPEQRGGGPCCHPLLHAHVGASSSGGVEARVPLPWLGPDQAIAWLLATIDPRLEPLED